MAKILLDYVFPITVIEPTAAASTAFLKQVCLVVKPKAGQEANVGNVYECTSMALVAARTDNTNAQQLFNAGMNKVFILLMDELDLTVPMEENASEFFTVLISDDFTDADVELTQASLTKGSLTFLAKTGGEGGNDISIEFLTGGTAGSEVVTVVAKKISVSMAGGVSTATQLKNALDASEDAMELLESTTIASGQGATAQAAFAEDNLENGDGLEIGTFDGVVGVSSDDEDFLEEQAAISKRLAFFALSANGAKNMCFAFGTLLANPSNWLNQQFISMPVDDGIDELGEAESLFDKKISFVIHDDEFSNRLALFAVGGKAIVEPYILKNMRIDMQSRALNWIAGNQPQYTLKEASLLETRIQEDVINSYIARRLIESGVVEITLVADNFVANGEINVSEPKALWRVFSEMRQTL